MRLESRRVEQKKNNTTCESNQYTDFLLTYQEDELNFLKTYDWLQKVQRPIVLLR